jgi:hypothetical protein
MLLLKLAQIELYLTEKTYIVLSVVAEVLARWETFNVSAKSSIRKNAYVKLELAKLDAAEGQVEELI